MRAAQKNSFGSNLPEINHSRQNVISHPIISLAQFFFVLVSFQPQRKLTARMRVLAAASCELPQWSGLQLDDFQVTCAPVRGWVRFCFPVTSIQLRGFLLPLDDHLCLSLVLPPSIHGCKFLARWRKKSTALPTKPGSSPPASTIRKAVCCLCVCQTLSSATSASDTVT